MATGIMALLAKPKGGGSKESLPGGDMGGEAAGGDEVASSLREMFDLLKAGDDSGAALAFRRAYESCAGGGEEEMPDMGDEGETEEDLDL